MVFLAAVLHSASFGSGAGSSSARISKCIPDTLGSEAFRQHQVFAFDEGRITQPLSGGLCLTATDAVTVQPVPSRRGQGWGLLVETCKPAAQAANQTWALTEGGNVVLASLGLCVDIAGYRRTDGAPAHLWPCTAPGANPCPPSVPCPATSCTCVANQQFRWAADGNVVGVGSGLCLDAGSTGAGPRTCDLPAWKNTSVCDTALAPAARAAALVAQGNLTEQIANLEVSAPGAGFARLGVDAPAFGEALHGVCTSCGTPGAGPNTTGCATSFPHALATASTFNRSLWSMVGGVVGVEGRALQNQHGGGAGVAYFAPNVNMYRDPRWGRGMEVPGEDPLVAGEYGARFVRAAQARGEGGLAAWQQRVALAPKHWLDYDMEGRHDAFSPAWGPSRNDFDAVVSRQEQVEYFLAQWHAVVAVGEPSGVMCSTNRINGVDTCMNPTYLDGFLRGRFNFTGFVVTDGNSCGNANCRDTVALQNASAAAQWGTVGHEIAAELCLGAGTDIELGQTLGGYTAGAIAAGRVTAAEVSRSNARVFAPLISQGHLEAVGPNDRLGPDDVDTARSRQIAFEAATQAMVLLKNEGGVLPLRAAGAAPGGHGQLKIAIVGPHLNSTDDLLSSHAYAGENKIVLGNSIRAAFERRAAASAGALEIVGAAGGCDIVTGCLSADLASVAQAVAGADVVLAFVGLHPSTGAPTAPGYGTACAEGEAWDRGDLLLCGQQQAILEAASAPGKPLVTVLVNGGTISATWVKQHSSAVLEAWYPGQAGGEAIVAVLMGDDGAHPGGRLPVTVYDDGFVARRNDSATGHNITDMSLRSGDGVTYMHYRGTPLWPFGFGLAYTSFDASLGGGAALLTATTDGLAAAFGEYYGPGGLAAEPLATLAVSVQNTGGCASDVVVLVFASRTSPQVPALNASAPLRQLVGFERAARLAPGERRSVTVGLTPLALCRVDDGGNQWAEPSEWALAATVDGVTMVNATLSITGARHRVLSWPTSTGTAS
jgi:beta-glucosidase-like glycosyl hydrolase